MSNVMQSTLNRDQARDLIKEIVTDSLGLDESEVTAEASMTHDLGAESIDWLDIEYRLRKRLNPEPQPQRKLMWLPIQYDDQTHVTLNGRITEAGFKYFSEYRPGLDLTGLKPGSRFSELEERAFKVSYLEECVFEYLGI